MTAIAEPSDLTELVHSATQRFARSDTPADLAPEPGIAAADLAGQTVKLPRIAIDVKRAVRLPNRTFAEALLAQVTVDPVGGRVSLGSDGQLVASSQPQPCE